MNVLFTCQNPLKIPQFRKLIKIFLGKMAWLVRLLQKSSFKTRQRVCKVTFLLKEKVTFAALVWALRAVQVLIYIYIYFALIPPWNYIPRIPGKAFPGP